MDLTKIYCATCGEKMTGAGAHLGGRINFIKMKCIPCNVVYGTFEMKNEFEYEMKATTSDDRKEERIRKATNDSVVKLALEITRIKEEKNS